MSFLTDSFTEASNTALASHTPEVGGTWSVQAGGTWTVNAANDWLVYDGNGYAWNTSASSADAYTETVGRTGDTAGSSRSGALVRHTGFARSNASTNNYHAYISGDGFLWLYKEVAGTLTQLGSSYTITGFSASTDYTVRVTANGTSIVAALNGTDRISVTDSAVTAAGYAGVYIRNSAQSITSIDADILGGASTVTHLIGSSLLNSRLTRSILN